jgi:integrase
MNFRAADGGQGSQRPASSCAVEQMGVTVADRVGRWGTVVFRNLPAADAAEPPDVTRGWRRRRDRAMQALMLGAGLKVSEAVGRYTINVGETDVTGSVPLSPQAVEILRSMVPLTGHGKYVFPSIRTAERCMSENTINAALRGLGYSKEIMTAHGFRAMARTIMDDVLGERVDLIEHQLAHTVSDPNGRAYNRTAHLPARREMMQRWADYLDNLHKGAEVIPLKAR